MVLGMGMEGDVSRRATALHKLNLSVLPYLLADYLVNDPCIVIWDTNTSRQKYLGICVSEESDGTYTIEHLERCVENESNKWKAPISPRYQDC